MLNEKAMLVNLHISMWTARKHDKNVSEEVAQNHSASNKAGRYNKHLLNQAEKLEALRGLAGKIREYFYSVTLPWTDDGYRVLASAMYFEFNEKFNEFKREYVHLVEDFFAEYPRYCADARVTLGSLHRASDYPSIEKLMKKFDIRTEIVPIPCGEDFRVSLGDDEKARVAREIDSQVKESLHRATVELWTRLQKAVGRVYATLARPKAKFYISSITNVAEIAELVPSLDLTKDEVLAEYAKEAAASIGSLDRQYLVDNPLARVAAAGVAGVLMSKINRTMSERGYEVAELPTVVEEAAKTVKADEEDDQIDVSLFSTGTSGAFQPPIPGIHVVPPSMPAMSADQISAKMSDFMEFQEAS